MMPYTYKSCGMMTGYDILLGFTEEITGSVNGIAFAGDVGSLDAPDFLPAGAMYQAERGEQYQRFAVRGM